MCSRIEKMCIFVYTPAIQGTGDTCIPCFLYFVFHVSWQIHSHWDSMPRILRRNNSAKGTRNSEHCPVFQHIVEIKKIPINSRYSWGLYIVQINRILIDPRYFSVLYNMPMTQFIPRWYPCCVFIIKYLKIFVIHKGIFSFKYPNLYLSMIFLTTGVINSHKFTYIFIAF